MQAQTKITSQWHDVCHLNDLETDSGVCALVGEIQVAIFKIRRYGEVSLYAISNWDPNGEANVMYRGIVGTLGDSVVVASPLYKEHYDLVSGICLEREDIRVSTYPVRTEQDRVLLEL